MFMRAYASSRVKRKSFYRKNELQLDVFVYFQRPLKKLVHQNCTPIWRLHTKLYKGAWNVSANNSETVGRKDLRLGEIVYILVFYKILFSWRFPIFMFVARQWKNLYRYLIVTIYELLTPGDHPLTIEPKDSGYEITITDSSLKL